LFIVNRQVALATITRFTQGLQILEDRLAALGPGENVVNHQDYYSRHRGTRPAATAPESVSTHDEKPQSPRDISRRPSLPQLSHGSVWLVLRFGLTVLITAGRLLRL